MYKKVWEKIKEYDSIVIFGHVLPDGDCYGSQIGLKYAILDNFPNKRAYIVGSGYPRMFDLIGYMDDIDDETIKNSLAVIIDVGNQDRIEDQRFRLAKEMIKLDHHIFQEHFGDPEIIETECVSTTELICKILIANNVKFTSRSAQGLFLGLVTDSGRFLYQPIKAETYYIAGKLVETGFDCAKIYDTLYEVDEKMLRFKGYVYTNYKKTPEGVSYLVLSKEELEKLGINYNTAASQVNTIANIKGCHAWVFFSESEEGMVRVELRSKDINVQECAVKFNGGGHLHASGCKLDSLSKYIDVVEELNKMIRSL